MTSAALIPVFSWIFLNAATCVLLTIPTRSRLYFLPAILVPAAISFGTIQYLDFVPGLSELWGSITLIGFIHFSSLLYIKRWTLHTTQSTKDTPTWPKIWLNRRRWIQLYKVALSPRFVRIPYKSVVIGSDQVKSTAIHDRFSMMRVVGLFVKIAVNLSLNGLIKDFLNPISIYDFAPARSVFLRRLFQPSLYNLAGPVSAREIAVRVWFTINSIWTPILLLDCIHTALAIAFIYVVRIDTPEDWPDLFGSPMEAYTLRSFWTRFWHRLHLSGYSDYSRLIISLLPRFLTQNLVLRKIFMTFLLFLISGLIHQVTTWQLDSDCVDYADIQFFCINAVAVVLESMLLQVMSLTRPSKNDKYSKAKGKDAQESLWNVWVRVVGYVWVLGFFSWAVPKVYYSRVYCMLDQQLQERMRKSMA